MAEKGKGRKAAGKGKAKSPCALQGLVCQAGLVWLTLTHSRGGSAPGAAFPEPGLKSGQAWPRKRQQSSLWAQNSTHTVFLQLKTPRATQKVLLENKIPIFLKRIFC